VVTLRAYYRKRQRTITEAEQRNVPIYVLRSNTVNQMLNFWVTCSIYMLMKAGRPVWIPHSRKRAQPSAR